MNRYVVCPRYTPFMVVDLITASSDEIARKKMIENNLDEDEQNDPRCIEGLELYRLEKVEDDSNT